MGTFMKEAGGRSSKQFVYLDWKRQMKLEKLNVEWKTDFPFVI